MSEAVDTVQAEAPVAPEAEFAEVVAQPEASDAQAVADAADPVKAAKPADEDPEIELDKDLRLKKSELARIARKRKELDTASFKRFQEAAEIRKRFEEQLSRDPEAYLRERGIDPIQFAVERLQREVALKEATPEQRALMEAQARIQALETERQTLAEQQEQAQANTLREQFVAKLDKELPVAVQKHNLPTDPLVFRAVAGVIADQIRNGLPEDPDGAAEMVADAYRATFKQHAATLKYEDAVKQYPEFVKLVREGDLARAKSGIAAPARPAARPPAPKSAIEEATNQGQQFEDYFRRMSGGPLSGL